MHCNSEMLLHTCNKIGVSEGTARSFKSLMLKELKKNLETAGLEVPPRGRPSVLDIVLLLIPFHDFSLEVTLMLAKST